MRRAAELLAELLQSGEAASASQSVVVSQPELARFCARLAAAEEQAPKVKPGKKRSDRRDLYSDFSDSRQDRSLSQSKPACKPSPLLLQKLRNACRAETREQAVQTSAAVRAAGVQTGEASDLRPWWEKVSAARPPSARSGAPAGPGPASALDQLAAAAGPAPSPSSPEPGPAQDAPASPARRPASAATSALPQMPPPVPVAPVRRAAKPRAWSASDLLAKVGLDDDGDDASPSPPRPVPAARRRLEALDDVWGFGGEQHRRVCSAVSALGERLGEEQRALRQMRERCGPELRPRSGRRPARRGTTA